MSCWKTSLGEKTKKLAVCGNILNMALNSFGYSGMYLLSIEYGLSLNRFWFSGIFSGIGSGELHVIVIVIVI